VWLLALGLLIALAVSGSFSGRRYLDASEWVTHTFEITEAIDRVRTLAQDVEVGQRGFLLSGDAAFLEPYEKGRAALPRSLARLRRLTRHSPLQQQNIDRLTVSLGAKLAFAEETLRLKRVGGDYAALVKTGVGKRHMDDIRNLAAEMRRLEEKLLSERTERAAGAQRQTILMGLLGVATTLGLVLFSLLMVQRDLRELRVLSEDLAVAEKMFRELAENATELVLLLDGEGRITYVSPSCERLLGYLPDELAKLDPASMVESEDLAAARSWIRELLTQKGPIGLMSLRYRTKAGDLRWFDVNATILRDGNESTPTILLSARDVHERRLAQEALERKTGELATLSETDGLTGLLNRRGFAERAQASLDAARKAGQLLAVVFVDLDGLKPINDQLGHEAGDRALREAAQLLRQMCRAGDLVARLGGDEFAVLAHDLGEGGFARFRQRVEGGLESLNAQSNRPFRLGFSLGAAFFVPSSDESLDSLLKRADGVMYEEKKRRKATLGAV